jgi:hypothetical protein
MTALVLRIKFPPTYPLIYKTVGVVAAKKAKPERRELQLTRSPSVAHRFDVDRHGSDQVHR